MAAANCHQPVETKSLALIDPPALGFTACIDECLTDWIPLAAANGTPKVFFSTSQIIRRDLVEIRHASLVAPGVAPLYHSSAVGSRLRLGGICRYSDPPDFYIKNLTSVGSIRTAECCRFPLLSGFIVSDPSCKRLHGAL